MNATDSRTPRQFSSPTWQLELQELIAPLPGWQKFQKELPLKFALQRSGRSPQEGNRIVGERHQLDTLKEVLDSYLENVLSNAPLPHLLKPTERGGAKMGGLRIPSLGGLRFGTRDRDAEAVTEERPEIRPKGKFGHSLHLGPLASPDNEGELDLSTTELYDLVEVVDAGVKAASEMVAAAEKTSAEPVISPIATGIQTELSTNPTERRSKLGRDNTSNPIAEKSPSGRDFTTNPTNQRSPNVTTEKTPNTSTGKEKPTAISALVQGNRQRERDFSATKTNLPGLSAITEIDEPKSPTSLLPWAGVALAGTAIAAAAGWQTFQKAGFKPNLPAIPGLNTQTAANSPSPDASNNPEGAPTPWNPQAVTDPSVPATSPSPGSSLDPNGNPIAANPSPSASVGGDEVRTGIGPQVQPGTAAGSLPGNVVGGTPGANPNTNPGAPNAANPVPSTLRAGVPSSFDTNNGSRVPSAPGIGSRSPLPNNPQTSRPPIDGPASAGSPGRSPQRLPATNAPRTPALTPGRIAEVPPSFNNLPNNFNDPFSVPPSSSGRTPAGRSTDRNRLSIPADLGDGGVASRVPPTEQRSRRSNSSNPATPRNNTPSRNSTAFAPPADVERLNPALELPPVRVPQPVSPDNTIPNPEFGSVPQTDPVLRPVDPGSIDNSQALNPPSINDPTNDPRFERLRTFYRGKWKPNPSLNSSLQYSVRINERNGQIMEVRPVGQDSQTHAARSGIRTGDRVLPPNSRGSSISAIVILSPDGTVDAFSAESP